MADDRLTYAKSGVDIDAGNRMVELIKPLVKRTARPGADADIGGFGGLFDLKRAGFRDPVLVASTDGVGTKVKIASSAGRHDTIGIDLVAMSVNDLVVQGAEPLFFLDYFACSKLDPEVGAAVVAGIAEGCRQAGCALIGGETAEMPGSTRTAIMTSPGLRSERRNAIACCHGEISQPGTSSSGSRLPGSTPTAIHWYARWSISAGPASTRQPRSTAGAAWATLCSSRPGSMFGMPGGIARLHGREGACPYYRRRLS